MATINLKEIGNSVIYNAQIIASDLNYNFQQIKTASESGDTALDSHIASSSAHVASKLVNDSSVTGAKISNALDKNANDLHAHITSGTAHGSDSIVNESTSSGSSWSDVVDGLQGQIDTLVLGASDSTIGVFSATASGTDTYTTTVATLTYFAGLKMNINFVNANTGASTLNLNALGAKDIKVRLQDGTLRDVQLNELVKVTQLEYDGTQFVINDNGSKETTRKVDNSEGFTPDRLSGNQKLGDDGQDEALFTASGTVTISADSSNVKIGSQSIRFTENDNSASNLAGAKNNITLDLSKLDNGSDSSDDDFIYVLVYVSDVNFVDTSNSMQIAFSQDSTYSGSNLKVLNYSGALSTGWNYLKLKKSNFSTTGSGAWDGIQSLYFRWKSLANAQNEYVSLQLIQLVKADPLDPSKPNYFQTNGARDFTINSGEWYVGLENGVNVWKQLDTSTTDLENALESSKIFTNCIMSTEISSGGTSNDVFALNYYTDSSNHVRIIILDDELQIKVRESASNNFVSTPFAISEDDFVRFVATIDNGSISVLAYKNNESEAVALTHTTSLTSGKMALGYDDALAHYKYASITELKHANTANRSYIADRLIEQPNDTVKNLSAQSIPDDVDTELNWTTSENDNKYSFLDPNDTTKIYLRHRGKYLVTIKVSYENNSTGNRTIYVKKNNSTIEAFDNKPAVNAALYFVTTFQITSDGDDYFEVITNQDSGVALDIQSVANRSFRMDIQQIA